MKLTNNLKIVKNNFNKTLPSHLKDLNARSKEIFSLIVDDFLKTGNPVGSRNLSFKMGEQLSPASIRNVMYDLQKSGLLKSNHTSAGRVPTDLGLRFFVDGLLQVGRIKSSECEEIKKTINNDLKNIEDLCNNASELLSGLSDCAGIVVAPKIGGRLKHIEFVPVSNDRALVILVTENGMIENRIIKIPKGLPSSLLTETTNYLNSITKGKSLLESKKLIKEQIKSDKIKIDRASRQLIAEGFACWDDASKKSKLIVTGTSKLLEDVKALEQLEDVRVLIEELENKKNLMGIIEETQTAEGLQIYIGSENNLFGLTDCSTIISPFRNQDKEIVGAIGVIGPMRINYAKIIPVVDYTAKLISEKFEIK